MVGTNYYLKIGPYIKELREKNNMTKTQLAEGICSSSYITRIENGQRCPTSVILRQIASKLGITTEHLFRAIESPVSLQVKEVLDQIFTYIERSDMKRINELITRKEKELDITSIHDIQIIRTFKCISTPETSGNIQSKMDELKDILALTYTEGNNPTDIEFILMFTYSDFFSSNNQKEKAYKYLKSLEVYLDSIQFFHTPVIVPAFYVILILACIDTSNFKDASQYLEVAINYCKENNTYSYLRELYFLNGELNIRLGNEKEFEIWYNKSLMLHDMIKNSDAEFFDEAIKGRLEKLEKLKASVSE